KYEWPLLDWHAHHYSGDNSLYKDGGTYGQLWQAFAIFKAGVDLATASGQEDLAPEVIALVSGIRGLAPAGPPAYFRAGQLIDAIEAPLAKESLQVQTLVPLLRQVKDLWAAMTA